MGANSTKRISRVQSGFTLIEVMMVVAIMAILATVALPSYSSYVLRGKLIEATNNLSAIRASMEQYYQDNRTYVDVSAAIVSPCDAAQLPTLQNFTLTCPVLTATTYTITATGSTTTTAGFTYSLTNANVQTSVVGATWGGGAYACWIMKKGSTC